MLSSQKDLIYLEDLLSFVQADKTEFLKICTTEKSNELKIMSERTIAKFDIDEDNNFGAAAYFLDTLSKIILF